jgi:hypothetical protein
MKSQSDKACVTEALLQLEQRRCAAIVRADALALENILSEDYVHVHATGDIDDRSGFIAGVLSNPRLVERSNIAVRIYGDVAILIGEQINRRNGTAARGTMQQVACTQNGVWRFISAQVTLKR